MFEKEFEFEVALPIEICEERIEEMGRLGCVQWLTFPTYTEVIASKRGIYTHFHAQRGQRRGLIAEIEGTLEAMDTHTTIVSGIARIQGIRLWLIVLFLLSVATITSIIYDESWFTAGFFSFLIVLQSAMLMSERNRIIRILEKALTQEAKKKRA